MHLLCIITQKNKKCTFFLIIVPALLFVSYFCWRLRRPLLPPKRIPQFEPLTLAPKPPLMRYQNLAKISRQYCVFKCRKYHKTPKFLSPIVLSFSLFLSLFLVFVCGNSSQCSNCDLK